MLSCYKSISCIAFFFVGRAGRHPGTLKAGKVKYNQIVNKLYKNIHQDDPIIVGPGLYGQCARLENLTSLKCFVTQRNRLTHSLTHTPSLIHSLILIQHIHNSSDMVYKRKIFHVKDIENLVFII